MSGFKFASLSDFAARFPAVAGGLCREVLAESQAELTNRALAKGQQATQSFPAGKSNRTGSHRAMSLQWRIIPANPLAAAKALKPTKVVNTAAHATIIDMGRSVAAGHLRRSPKTGRRTAVRSGRAIGSLQLPQGISRPVMDELESEFDAIVAGAVAKVEGRAG